MADPRNVVERGMRQVRLQPWTAAEFHRRRIRIQRRQRVTAGVVAAVVVAAAAVLGARALTHDGGTRPVSPITVPSGSIAFVGQGPSSGGATVFLFDPATGATSTLVDRECPRRPAGCRMVQLRGLGWSPDGTRLAYSVQTVHGPGSGTVPARPDGIFVLDLRTGRTRQLTSLAPCPGGACTYDGALAWSPDSSTIAFTEWNAGVSSIWTMSATGGGRREVVSGPAEDPAWTPDGRRIVVATPTGLFAVAAGGGTPALLDVPAGTVDQSALWAPAMSPDGDRVAFLERTNGPESRLWLARLGGGPPRAVTALRSNRELSAPSWSPDGSKLAVISDGRLIVLDADGTNPRQLTRAWSSNPPAWYPGRSAP